MHYLMMIYLFKSITPADAGNTLVTKKEAEKIQDHPRRCGKYHSEKEKDYQKRGSPPQMREIH